MYYKRIPRNIRNSSEEQNNVYVITGSHDGYIKNFGLSVKRTLKIKKDGLQIIGSDIILALRTNNKKNSFEIRFHLMPEISCLFTNNDKQIIIKSKSGSAWYLRSLNNKLRIDESLYLGSGDKPLATKQIVIYGNASKIKNIVNWELKKIS